LFNGSVTAHVLTIDFECWPQMVTHDLTGRTNQLGGVALARQTRRILDLLARYDVKATFFVLGMTAEAWPELVSDIHNAGHEIGSHGYTHGRLDRIGPGVGDDIRRGLTRSRQLLTEITGVAPLGFRAPEFSIGRRNLHALDAVADAGYRYDASIFPIRHRRYGVPGWPRRPVEVAGGRLISVPVGTLRLDADTPWGPASMNLPISGGGYWRALPQSLVIKSLDGLTKEDVSTVLYLHPYQLDEFDPPPIEGLRGLVRLRAERFRRLQTVGRSRVFETLQAVLPRYQWITAADLAGLGSQATTP
jgi:polysaccharide deacetylase family protein (PEP-CTERM system associated)